MNMQKDKYMKFRYLFIISLLAFIITACEDPAIEMRKELNDGIKELYIGNHTEAIIHFNNVIAIDSTQSEAHLYLGRAYFNQAKYPEAMSEYNAAIRLNSKYGQAYKSRAQLWFILDDRTKSCKDYVKAEDLGVKNLINYTQHCR